MEWNTAKHSQMSRTVTDFPPTTQMSLLSTCQGLGTYYTGFRVVCKVYIFSLLDSPTTTHPLVGSWGCRITFHRYVRFRVRLEGLMTYHAGYRVKGPSCVAGSIAWTYWDIWDTRKKSARVLDKPLSTCTCTWKLPTHPPTCGALLLTTFCISLDMIVESLKLKSCRGSEDGV